MARKKPQRPVTTVLENSKGTTGVFHYDPETETEAVLLFDFDISSSPLEQRLWRAQWPLNSEQQMDLLNGFDYYPKSGITDEVRRTAPWSAMQAAVRSHVGAGALKELIEFHAPSPDTVTQLIENGLLPSGFRNQRDMAGHAAELRAVKEYLLAVYRDGSVTPMKQVAAAEDVTVMRARNLIDRARQHRYLTRTEGLGGELTSHAHDVAQEFEAARRRIPRN